MFDLRRLFTRKAFSDLQTISVSTFDVSIASCALQYFNLHKHLIHKKFLFHAHIYCMTIS